MEDDEEGILDIIKLLKENIIIEIKIGEIIFTGSEIFKFIEENNNDNGKED